MKKPPEWMLKARDEWEFTALAVLVILLLIALFAWVSALLGDGGANRRLPSGNSPPLPEQRINYDSAYAMLRKEAPEEAGDLSAFRENIEFKDPSRRKPPRPQPKDPKPERPRKDPKPDPGGGRKPPPKPDPGEVSQPEPEPDPEFFVYRGYRRSEEGERVAILHNETTGQNFVLRKGRRFTGLLVFDFTSSELTFLKPNGDPFVLGPDDKLPYRPKK
jgi:outer membrane biosynthesis protein TonB